MPAPGRIFHIATAADWEAARRSGSYTTSTYGVSLAEEGFIHASRADQWPAVRERWYAGVQEPLVLLVVDTGRLTSPVVEEVPSGASESFPHVYGPIDLEAVVHALPIGTGREPRPATGPSLGRLFLDEVVRTVVVATAVLVCVAAGSVAGALVAPDWGALAGIGVGLLVGVAAAVGVHRRWRAA